MKKLVAFGCSWTFGDELEDSSLQIGESVSGHKRDELLNQYRLDHCFAGFFAKHYGLELVNLGFPGASEESIRYTLNWYIDNHNTDNTIFLVAHTDATRKSWFNTQHVATDSDPEWNRFMHSPWLKTKNKDIDSAWYDMQKLWTAMSYHYEWTKNNLQETVQQFDWVHCRLGVPVLQVNALNNPPVRPVQSYNSDVSLLQMLRNHSEKDLFKPLGHPNEKGHSIIANHLINLAESSKIIEC